jgi:anti-repressor protein
MDGFYAPCYKMDSLLKNDDYILLRAQQILTKRLEIAESKIKELEPKAQIYDQISDCTNLKSIGEVAKILGTGRDRLFEILRSKSILMKNNLPYQEYIERLYFFVKTKPLSGINKDYSQTFVTSKGEIWLAKIIKDN